VVAELPEGVSPKARLLFDQAGLDGGVLPAQGGDQRDSGFESFRSPSAKGTI
jgi:hypothetical protein